MKKNILIIGSVFALFGIGVLTTSLTRGEAKKTTEYSPQVIYTVPLKPQSTVIVYRNDMNKYLKKGYQVQEVLLGEGTVLMIKY